MCSYYTQSTNQPKTINKCVWLAQVMDVWSSREYISFDCLYLRLHFELLFEAIKAIVKLVLVTCSSSSRHSQSHYCHSYPFPATPCPFHPHSYSYSCSYSYPEAPLEQDLSLNLELNCGESGKLVVFLLLKDKLVVITKRTHTDNIILCLFKFSTKQT